MSNSNLTNSIPVYGSCDARFAKVREIFQRSFDTGVEIGASVSFVLDGKSVVDLWGGHYDAARTREWERDTLVNVFSTTKGMTAICANQLLERGLLDLEAPVAKYWPEFAAAGKENLPVKWLLTHQAGLPGISEPLPLGALYDWQLMCDALAAQKPWWTPGDGFGYHVFTYGFLVGELIRRVTGTTIGNYFRQHIAEPLDADFHIGLAEQHDTRTADMYGVSIGNKPVAPVATLPTPITGPFAEFARAIQDPATMQYAALMNPPQTRDAVNSRAWRAAEIPAANGHGTARSIARIYGALARGGEIDGVRILKQSTIDRATTEEVSGPERVFLGGLSMRYGLGFSLSESSNPYARLSPNPRAFGHTGAGGSLGMADPDAKIGFGFAMNSMQAGMLTAGATATAVIDAFYAALA
jgi:CubicO group peptidase (beta-lactamase class C family)